MADKNHKIKLNLHETRGVVFHTKGLLKDRKRYEPKFRAYFSELIAKELLKTSVLLLSR